MRENFRSATAVAMAIFATCIAAVAAQTPTFVTQQQATLLMKNGERHSGTLVYHNNDQFSLIVGGQEQSHPIADIAVVELRNATPSAAELAQLPTSDNPPELERHMLVLKDGTVLHGKFYTFKERAVTFDTQAGERRDFDLGTVDRLYMSAPGARQLFARQIGSQPATPAAQATPASGGIRVDGKNAWTDTGVTVRRGDRVGFSSNGEVSFRGDERVGPDGSSTEGRDGVPVPSVGVGGLIGRVGSGAPFAIGSNNQLITMPAAGRLYLGINDSGTGDNGGAFAVTIIR